MASSSSHFLTTDQLPNALRSIDSDYSESSSSLFGDSDDRSPPPKPLPPPSAPLTTAFLSGNSCNYNFQNHPKNNNNNKQIISIQYNNTISTTALPRHQRINHRPFVSSASASFFPRSDEIRRNAPKSDALFDIDNVFGYTSSSSMMMTTKGLRSQFPSSSSSSSSSSCSLSSISSSSSSSATSCSKHYYRNNNNNNNIHNHQYSAMQLGNFNNFHDTDDIFSQPFISNADLGCSDDSEDGHTQTVFFYDPATSNLVPTSTLRTAKRCASASPPPPPQPPAPKSDFDFDAIASSANNQQQQIISCSHQTESNLDLSDTNRKAKPATSRKKANKKVKIENVENDGGGGGGGGGGVSNENDPNNTNNDNKTNIGEIKLPKQAFPCPIDLCDRIFWYEIELKRHMAVHSSLWRSNLLQATSATNAVPDIAAEITAITTTSTPANIVPSLASKFEVDNRTNDNNSFVIFETPIDNAITITSTGTAASTPNNKKKKKTNNNNNNNNKTKSEDGEESKSKCSSSTQRVLRFACDFADCGRRFARADVLREHERVHRNIRPYVCRWDGCKFEGVSAYRVVEHIRKVHFRWRQGRPIDDCRNAYEFLLVRNELL